LVRHPLLFVAARVAAEVKRDRIADAVENFVFMQVVKLNKNKNKKQNKNHDERTRVNEADEKRYGSPNDHSSDAFLRLNAEARSIGRADLGVALVVAMLYRLVGERPRRVGIRKPRVAAVCDAVQIVEHRDVSIAAAAKIRIRFVALAVVVMSVVVRTRFVMHYLCILNMSTRQNGYSATNNELDGTNSLRPDSLQVE
jgi:hypothetical protein